MPPPSPTRPPPPAPALRLAADAAAALLWISLSAGVILFNKHILARAGFPFPITLTLWHMVFCAGLATALVRAGAVAACPTMDAATYVRAVAPVGALFAGTLWFGNAAYVFLSVSFIQMLKALMPAAVFGVGCALGTEAFKWGTVANMAVVTGGVALARSPSAPPAWRPSSPPSPRRACG